MAEMLRFKKGLFEALPETKSAGTIYVTTDERAMYVDINDSERIRLGDVIQVDTVNKLRDMAPKYSHSALYYVIDENALLKYTGNSVDEHSWIQINSVSDVTANLDVLTGKVTALETSVSNITKEDGLIATAKSEAIAAAATDASTKADKAKADAIADADAKFETVNTALEGKVATSTYNTKIGEIEADILEITGTNGLIATAKQEAIDAAATDATTKANAAQAAAIADADTKLASKVDKSAYDTKVTELTTAIGKAKTDAVSEAAADATAKANKALEDANSYTDTEIGKVNTTIGEVNTALDGKVDKSTYNTKVGEIDAAIENIIKTDGLIAVAKQEAIDAAATDATTKANTAESNAKQFATDELAKKVDKSTYNTKVGEIEADILEITGTDGLIAQAEARAAETAQSKADAAKQAAITSANGYTDGKVTDLTGLINGKVDQSAYNTKVSAIESSITDITKDGGTIDTKVAAAEGRAATDAQNKADAAKQAAISHADTELAKKVDQSAYDTKVTELTTAIATAKSEAISEANSYTDDAIGNALEAADAMTFKGVLGSGEGFIGLPENAEEVAAGDTYKIGQEGDYAGIYCYVGDLLIAKTDGVKEYYHISTGYEDDYDAFLTVDEENNKVIMTNSVNKALGSIQFAGEDGVTVSVEGTPGESGANSIVTVSIEWGSF